jgi:hypothetical protein
MTIVFHERCGHTTTPHAIKVAARPVRALVRRRKANAMPIITKNIFRRSTKKSVRLANTIMPQLNACFAG